MVFALRNILPIAALLLLVSVAAHAQEAPLSIPGAKTVDADAIITLVETTPNLVILDNRKDADFAAGHIEGAIRLLDTDIADESVLAKHIPAKTQPVLFYCNGLKCGRAAKAASLAVKAGYTQVFYYALGMDEWREKKLPVVKG